MMIIEIIKKTNQNTVKVKVRSWKSCRGVSNSKRNVIISTFTVICFFASSLEDYYQLAGVTQCDLFTIKISLRIFARFLTKLLFQLTIVHGNKDGPVAILSARCLLSGMN